LAEESVVMLRSLHRRFTDEVVAVESLDLDIMSGEFFSLIGPSGCGKTTTLRLVAGLDMPTSGTVSIGGHEVTWTPAYKRPVNTVFQSYALFPHLNVVDNVGFGLREKKIPRRERAQRVSDMLDLVRLRDRGSARPRELSGGQQQRVALARALVLEPKVLLLDEPLGALDLKLRKAMQSLLKEIQASVGITFVYVTHDQEEAFSMSGRVGVMNQGRLEQVGEPREVYRRPATAFVADFVGASNHLDVVVCETVDAGTYVVRNTGTGTTMMAEGPVGIETGSEATLVIRPEAVRLAGVPGKAFESAGVITEVSYSGPQTRYSIDVDGVGSLSVSAGAGQDLDFEVGERLPAVSCQPSGTWLIGPEESAGQTTDAEDPAPARGQEVA
jgi:spermidine/putrescine transport system ATP-binding protein